MHAESLGRRSYFAYLPQSLRLAKKAKHCKAAPRTRFYFYLCRLFFVIFTGAAAPEVNQVEAERREAAQRAAHIRRELP